MSFDRKSFLKVAATGGIGLLFGNPSFAVNRWKERGVSLVKVERSSLAMGSVVQFQVVAGQEKDGYEAIRKGIEVFRNLDTRLSMYDSSSEMGVLSKRAGKQVVSLSDDAINVLSFAKQVWAETSGLFDVTIEPAMKRWGFRKNPSSEIKLPTDNQLKRLERIIGADKLIIENGKAYLEKQGMAVDLGGIAGGYALDQAIDQMKKQDIAAAFINFSGDIHCFGNPLEHSGWPVHIYNPHTGEPIPESVILHNEALSTSGSYQNRRRNGSNKSWGHLLSPTDANPVDHAGSVTAIHPSAMMADAWSTAAYVGATQNEELRWVIL